MRARPELPIGMGEQLVRFCIVGVVRSACTPVTSASTNGKLSSAYDGRLYDCRNTGDAIRAAVQV